LKTLLLLSLLGACATRLPQGEAITGAQLWEQYKVSPHTHSHIPNVSYAGYRNSEEPLPSPAVIVNLHDWAKGDGIADDTAAFAKAIEKAHSRGGGAVLVPEGRYRVTGLIRLDRSGVVLRGAGPDKTVLIFEKSLTDILGPRKSDEESEYSWVGGLLHIGVHGDFGEDGRLNAKEEFPQSWNYEDTICRVQREAPRGSKSVICDREGASKLGAGQWVMMLWRNKTSLLDEISGIKSYPWDIHGKSLRAFKAFRWPVQIASVDGSKITLRQPLRLPIGTEWKVSLSGMGAIVQEVGVEGLTLRMPALASEKHNHEKGFSGIFMNRVVNGWVRNVRLVNVDNGILASAIKNVTISDVEIVESIGAREIERKMHHGFELRAGCHDVLTTDFEISSRVIHGLSTEGFSSGNVWRRGRMDHGSFDSHKHLPFESVRTFIKLHNDGERGGPRSAGPAQGTRMVHWNIMATGKGENVLEPDIFPSGALVGIRGVEQDNSSDADCEQGCQHPRDTVILADEGVEPTPPDLFRAQLDLRLGRERVNSILHEAPLPGLSD
jgi:hypothetical protein